MTGKSWKACNLGEGMRKTYLGIEARTRKDLIAKMLEAGIDRAWMEYPSGRLDYFVREADE